VAGPSTAEAVARLPATTAAEDVRARLVQPSSDPIDLDALVRLRLAVSRLGRRIRQRGGSGVTPSQLSVLFSVARLQPVSLGELAAVEDVQPPSITRCVATLEAAGLVAREGSRSDRRVSRVHLTDAGAAFLAEVRSSRDAWFVGLAARLDPSELSHLIDALPALERLVDLSSDATRPDDPSTGRPPADPGRTGAAPDGHAPPRESPTTAGSTTEGSTTEGGTTEGGTTEGGSGPEASDPPADDSTAALRRQGG